MFCIFSVVGHWLEIAYCSFMDLFGIVADDSLVWDDPFYPFIVYGVGTLVCSIMLVPLKDALVARFERRWIAGIIFYAITVIICMLMELCMGLMLNQPDQCGNYPLWDNSELPLNIFEQAWLINDIVLGSVAMLYTWIVYPICVKGLERMPAWLANILSVVIIVGFLILCVAKF